MIILVWFEVAGLVRGDWAQTLEAIATTIMATK
jgi:hypothetical protein